jgi:hypothetical protein
MNQPSIHAQSRLIYEGTPPKPVRCIACKTFLYSGERFICAECRSWQRLLSNLGKESR